MLQVSKLLAEATASRPCCSSARPRSNSTGTCARRAASTPPIRKAASSACSCRAAPWCAAATCWWRKTARWSSVIAAPQPVLVITHCSEHGTPFDLTRAAYHLGNRHVADRAQARPPEDRTRPRAGRACCATMHLIVREDARPFEPEGGAYAAQARRASAPRPAMVDHDTARPHDHALTCRRRCLRRLLH